METEQVHPCYGKHWDPKEPVCAGGIDHAKPGDFHHSRCPSFDQCRDLTAARRLGNTAMLLPPSSLTRPPVQAGAMAKPTTVAPPPVPLAVAPTSPGGGLAALANRLAPQTTQPAPFYPQAQPPAQPVQPVPPVYQMPGFLGTPEPIQPGEHWVWPMLREIGRGSLKGAMHTGASFVDRVPWGKVFGGKK